MVVLAPDMFARTRPVLRRSTSLKWTHEQQQQQHQMKRMPSPSPTRILTQQHSNIPHVQSMPKLTSPSIVKTVNIPVQSPPPHAPHQSTPHPHAHPHPRPRPTLHPSRPSPMAQSSSLPALSPVATPTRPPLLRRVVTPTRPSPLRRTSAHMDGTTFERVTRRRLLSPTPITTSSSSTTIAPPPSPASPTRRRIPRRFTFAPIHIVTSQLRDSNVTEMEHDMIRHQHENQYEQENITPAKDLVKWWAERESPVWQPPPALHTLIEDDWEERQQQPSQHHIAPSTQTSCTSSTSTYTTTSSRTPLRPPPILLPHTVSSTPGYRYNPITPTCPNRELELQSPPPLFGDNEIANVMLSPSFANLSMDVDMMAQLPQGWQSQDMGQVTPTTASTITWTPRVMDDLTHDIGKWINMDTQ